MLEGYSSCPVNHAADLSEDPVQGFVSQSPHISCRSIWPRDSWQEGDENCIPGTYLNQELSAIIQLLLQVNKNPTL